MYQCLVQLCKVFAIKSILTINIEELKYQLCLHFKEHKCYIFKNILEKRGGCAINVLVNKTVITCLIMFVVRELSVFPQILESGLHAFFSESFWSRFNFCLKSLFK